MNSLKISSDEKAILWLAVSEELKRQRHYASVLDDDYAKSIALRSINLLEGIEYKLDARRQLEELERSK